MRAHHMKPEIRRLAIALAVAAIATVGMPVVAATAEPVTTTAKVLRVVDGDTIVAGDEATARRFLHEVDSATVLWNASTRMADGGQVGLGAEIGISTDKLHARGPMGVDELTSYKWVVIGTGQIRK